MKSKKWLVVLMACLLVLTMVLTACNPNNPQTPPNNPPENPDGGWQNPGDNLGGGGQGEIAEEADATATNATIKDIKDKSDLSELASDTSSDNATKIAPTTNVVEISKSGTYVFEGEYGGILNTKKNASLHFIFKNATFTNENGIAIDCQDTKVESLIITLVDGTTNTVTNSGDDVNAIHVKGGNLSINGKGTLNVVSNSKNALKCGKAIQIVDAKLNLTATNHAITGAAVIASNCTINVASAGKDGINVECDEAESFTTDDGFVSLTSVNYTCKVYGDGIQANTAVYIDGGNYDITTIGEFVADTANNRTTYGLSADDFKYVKTGNNYKRIAPDERTSATKYAFVQSCKGIKVTEIEYKDEYGNTVTVTDGDYVIAVASGTFNFDSTDDAIHTNSGSVIISGGEFTIATLDDAITSDYLTKITGGDITVTNCYEGIEGVFVEIGSGTIDIVANDDGINASSNDRTVTPHIIISGGDVTVDAIGDGIDSNGSILISGGTVVVHGPTSGADAGLDADKGIVITGGTVFVTSTLGMVETPSTNSTQYVVSYAHQSTISAGSTVSIVDSNNNVIMSYQTLKSCQSIILSCSALQKGSTYYIYGGTTQLASFTVSSIITTVGSAGSTFPGGGRPGGPGGPR